MNKHRVVRLTGSHGAFTDCRPDKIRQKQHGTKAEVEKKRPCCSDNEAGETDQIPLDEVTPEKTFV